MANEIEKRNETFLIYQDENGIARVNVRFEGEDVWLTVEQIMELFDASQQDVSYHIKQIYADGALDDDDTKAIRQKLIENDKVEAIILLPRNMFYSTDISVTLWILNNNKKGGPRHGRMLRNREGEVLFVDLRTWNDNIYEKKFVKLSEEQIAEVCKIYFDWATTASENYAQPELYYAAHLDEIREKGFSLVPSRYIEFVDRDTEIDYQSALTQMSQQFDALKKRWDENEATLVNAFKVLGYGKE